MKQNEKELLADALVKVAQDIRDGNVHSMICFTADRRESRVSFGATYGHPLMVTGLVKQASLLNEMEIAHAMQNNLKNKYFEEQETPDSGTPRPS